MVTAAIPGREIVNLIASEMASAVEKAVECWMAEFEGVLADTSLTTLGRLNAVREILENYKSLTGKTQLQAQSRPPVSIIGGESGEFRCDV